MSREVYDKIYFNDDYSRQFSELRERYHDRTQAALRGRKQETAPMPNATTIVLMEDLPDGGVTIKNTGDFASYYKQRCGHDRLGEVRKSLSDARVRSEMREMRDKAHRASEQARKGTVKKGVSTQKKRVTHRSRFSFAHALLAMMLLLSMVMFFGTSALLDNTVEELKAMKSEVATMQNDESAVMLVEESEIPESTTLSGADSVEVYESTEEEEGFSVMALLNALASLGKKE